MTGLDFRNTNTLWSSILAESLYRLGLRTAVICPGSRSTPLTVALARHREIEAIPILDERSAAFFALGIAKRTGRATLLVCTSGTAGANFYGAVIEAHASRVPLLLLTADRPPELRHCNAGQTIDQQKLFGDFPNAFLELALPSVEPDMLAYLRQTLCHAWARSHAPVPGPVHLNLPFRDPLPPIADPTVLELEANFDSERFFAAFDDSEPPILLPATLPDAVKAWLKCDRGLIIAGVAQPINPDGYCRAIARLSDTLRWPVLAEGLSPIRNYAAQFPGLVSTYDALLRSPDRAASLRPDLIVRIGETPTSKVLRQWLQATQARQWMIDGGDRNLDPTHSRTVHLPFTIEQLAETLPVPNAFVPNAFVPNALLDISGSGYLKDWIAAEQQMRTQIDHEMASSDPFNPGIKSGTLDYSHSEFSSQSASNPHPQTDTGFNQEPPFFEGKVAWLLSQCLPVQTPVFIANSTPVRDVEWFWKPGDRQIQPFVNRGANGIDGTLSTALGIAHRYRSSVLLTGDLACLHDTNGMLVSHQLQGHLTIVLINNGGGGIFGFLPIAQFNPPFEDFFATPQTVEFATLCAAYGIEHESITSWEMLADRLHTLPDSGLRVLEIVCDRHQDAARRQAFWSSIQ
ncbi:MAG: 2-succinyl-5-enolpyruvyl-6-hydroxy-3-cyclohexene-1-carboxylic-acid synthase [Elainellaceae cyanobacterium]